MKLPSDARLATIPTAVIMHCSNRDYDTTLSANNDIVPIRVGALRLFLRQRGGRRMAGYGYRTPLPAILPSDMGRALNVVDVSRSGTRLHSPNPAKMTQLYCKADDSAGLLACARTTIGPRQRAPPIPGVPCRSLPWQLLKLPLPRVPSFVSPHRQCTRDGLT